MTTRERSAVRALPVGSAKYWSSSRCASRVSVAAWVDVNAVPVAPFTCLT